MKYIFYLVLILICTSCFKEEIVQSDDIIGRWSVYSAHYLSNDSLALYPDSLTTEIIADFNSETVTIYIDNHILFGCDNYVAGGSYIAKTDGSIEIEPLPYKLACGYNWVKTVARGLTIAVKYSIESDELIIHTNKMYEEMTLTFKKFE